MASLMAQDDCILTHRLVLIVIPRTGQRSAIGISCCPKAFPCQGLALGAVRIFCAYNMHGRRSNLDPSDVCLLFDKVQRLWKDATDAHHSAWWRWCPWKSALALLQGGSQQGCSSCTLGEAQDHVNGPQPLHLLQHVLHSSLPACLPRPILPPLIIRRIHDISNLLIDLAGIEHKRTGHEFELGYVLQLKLQASALNFDHIRICPPAV
mmetsp:Transcript_10296/g.21276  ORF Transcript_10296/g.21276 Transcript_10296/m.21276 type:complete len:208 (+) Transcript_10296:301-924(+)